MIRYSKPRSFVTLPEVTRGKGPQVRGHIRDGTLTPDRNTKDCLYHTVLTTLLPIYSNTEEGTIN